MVIKKVLNGDELTVALTGELNSSSAPELELEMETALEGIKTLIFEFSELTYLSSAGLRVLLVMQKAMAKQGKMIVRHANENIMDIFNITGFANILDIEN